MSTEGSPLISQSSLIGEMSISKYDLFCLIFLVSWAGSRSKGSSVDVLAARINGVYRRSYVMEIYLTSRYEDTTLNAFISQIFGYFLL